MPTKATRIELFDTPQSVPLDRLLDEQVTALIAAGIVNPNDFLKRVVAQNQW